MTRRARRPGFTLLEVLLASVIAVLLLAALYVALDVTVGQTDASREQVASNNLSRAVINRMSSDLTQSLGPLPPKSGGGSSTASNTQSAPTTQPSGQQTTQTTGQQSTQQTGSQTTPTGQSGEATTPTDPAVVDTTSPDGQFYAADVPFQAGVMGSDKVLTVFVSRLPITLTDAAAATATEFQQPADLRRVTYYLAADGSGLCRQERPWVTADGVRNSVEPDRTDELADLIAPEVKDVTFEYLDAGTWLGEWDGSLLGVDGVTVTGPPRAVRATFVLEVPVRGGTIQKTVQHVFPVRAAVGGYAPPTDGAVEDPTMTDPALTGGTYP